MKSKGKIAWLITWEGPEWEYTDRCKVVAILRPQRDRSSIECLLPVLFASEYNYTLCEKMGSLTARGKEDSFFYEAYRHINPEMWYGHFTNGGYLCARRVKNLRCEESKMDSLEYTLYWTELPRFVFDPDRKPEDPLPANPADSHRQVDVEREAQYTYSIRPAIERIKASRAKQFEESKQPRRAKP
jgi:hypothetical protein